jgi:hypothetical protein
MGGPKPLQVLSALTLQVAGGITYKYSTHQTMVKECDEEASIPEHIAEKVG